MEKADGKVEEMNRAVHRFLEAIGSSRMDKWSDIFEGLGGLEIRILRMTAEQPDIILKEIRDVLDIPQSTLTSVIDRLEKRGLLKRVISRRDRRSFGLILTKRGWRVEDEHDRLDRMGASLVIEVLGEREGRRFVNMLSKISRRFEEAYAERHEGGSNE